MIGVSVLGNGVVASGVCGIILNERELMQRRCGQQMELRFVLVRHDYESCTYKEHFTKDVNEIVNDGETYVVVEAMGGVEPAYSYVRAALEAKKCVVTANKHLIAEKGCELLQVARENGVKLLFEAAVGGTIPIIRPLHRCLAANEIEEIQGILNGTSNFILTQMGQKNMDFAQAVKLAQELGYAETDPSADVNGTDTCRKLCILTSIACGRNVTPDMVSMEGIEGITAADVSYAAVMGYSIKLLAVMVNNFDGSAQMIVAPHLIPPQSPLSGVNDVFNAVQITGRFSGAVMMYGRGAGSFPTASAVVGDIIDCASDKVPQSTLSWSEQKLEVESDLHRCVPYYVRVKGRVQRQDTVMLGCGMEDSAFITTPINRVNLDKWLMKNQLEPLSIFAVIE